MNSEEYKKTLAINEKISTVILLFLLLLRLVDANLPIWIFGANIPSWYAYWYAGIAYILTVSIVLLNRHRLASLNIDRPFVIALMIGGFLCLFFLTPDIGILAAIAAALVFWAYQDNLLVLKNTVEYPSETLLLILFSLLLAVLPIIFFHPILKQPVSLQLILATITSTFQAQLVGIAFEDVIFRGALWAYLRDLGLKEHIAFLVQAFLFWIAHSKYMFLENPYFFWVSVPLVSLLLGFIVWRSRSLTPSTIAHLLFNSTGTFIKNIF